MRFLPLLFLLSTTGTWAGEYVLLASGARLHVDRHEADGSKVRLYNGDGTIEIEAAQVVGYEADEESLVTPIPPKPPDAPVPLSPEQLADAAADRYGLPRTLVRSILAAESNGQARAVSPKGAVGLMQLMPATAQELGSDPNDAAQNVDAGVRYLRQLLEKYHGGLYHALAAYNAGPAAVDKYNGIPPYRETLRYVDRIAKEWKRTATSAGSDPASPPK